MKKLLTTLPLATLLVFATFVLIACSDSSENVVETLQITQTSTPPESFTVKEVTTVAETTTQAPTTTQETTIKETEETKEKDETKPKETEASFEQTFERIQDEWEDFGNYNICRIENTLIEIYSEEEDEFYTIEDSDAYVISGICDGDTIYYSKTFGKYDGSSEYYAYKLSTHKTTFLASLDKCGSINGYRDGYLYLIVGDYGDDDEYKKIKISNGKLSDASKKEYKKAFIDYDD